MLHDRRYMGPTGHRRMFGGEGSIVKPLIIANVVVFFLTGLGRRDSPLTLLLKLHPHYIERFELWRLGTYMFVHGGPWHIILNMWGLFLFGRPVEQRIGGRRFLQLYFTSGLIGALSWLVFNWNVDIAPATVDGLGRVVDVWGGVVGASGGVFGVMMAAAMMFPNMVIVLLFPPIPMKLKWFVAVYGAIEVVQALSRGGGRIAHIAHLGGLLGAFLYMRWLSGGQQGRGSLLDDLRVWWERRQAEARRRRFRMDAREDRQDDGAPTTNDMDRILDKIGREGLASLTPDERRTLERAREELRDKRGR